MPLPRSSYPKQSHILLCDFRGFVAPEMVKVRPVVVVSPSARHGSRLCTVVPLSTTPPNPVMPWHFKLSYNPNPLENDNTEIWAKCDMLYTVSFDRLDKFHRKTRQGREYLSPSMRSGDFELILQAVRSYLGLLG